jgi:hypothetical protein
MIEVSRCKECNQMGVINNTCFYCEELKEKNKNFLQYLIHEVFLDYRCICFMAVSIMNGIFMKHFNYSWTEILAQAVCLGIILPGLFRND